MIITNPEELKKYSAPYRVWQGIPSIERTRGGRLVVAFYSGGVREELGNYVVLLRSEDGVTYTDPITVVDEGAQYRCFDQCLWTDPMGRLWLVWARMPECSIHAAICDDPDAETPVWSREFVIADHANAMMNRPTVLSSGEWLFPISAWGDAHVYFAKYNTDITDRRALVYRTTDGGATFEKLGGSTVGSGRSTCDEHMLLELKDGRIAMYCRTFYGIGVAYSQDRGKTWSECTDSGLGGPDSRFHIRRLASGRILLVNHFGFQGRNNLTALLSEDEGKTWPYRLLLDERPSVSYPDAIEDEDGSLSIIYDRERGSCLESLEQVYKSAREILLAKITEEDIMAGKLVSRGSYLKRTVSKLGKYAGDGDPFSK